MKFGFQFQIIYVARNPRDTCISFYNFIKVAEGYKGSLADFTDAFLNDITGYYSPFIHHVLTYWKVLESQKNVLFLTYEEMKMDLEAVVRKMAKFLDKPLPENMESFLDHLSFDKMKSNKAVNKEDFMEVKIHFLSKNGQNIPRL